MRHAAKYYANILWPFAPLILKKVDEVVKMGIPIDMIAPSHGLIWRKDPGESSGPMSNGARERRRKRFSSFTTPCGAARRPWQRRF